MTLQKIQIKILVYDDIIKTIGGFLEIYPTNVHSIKPKIISIYISSFTCNCLNVVTQQFDFCVKTWNLQHIGTEVTIEFSLLPEDKCICSGECFILEPRFSLKSCEFD